MRSHLAFSPLLAVLPAMAFAGAAQAVVIGGPKIQDGMEIVPGYLMDVQLDRNPVPAGAQAVHLQADIHATREDAHGFGEGAFIPYLSVSFLLTKDGVPTFHKSGLLYPIASRNGPHYGSSVELAGPGSYRLTYIVSPPSAHGMLRQTDKTGGIPDWGKPVTASWTFTYPPSTSAPK